MSFFEMLLFGNPNYWGGGVAHSVFILALVITMGIILGRIKIAGISLGITWILFAGITLAHFGMQLDPHLLHFMKEFGLILFVYSIGLQVGPGFFAAFQKGGLKLNMIATSSVLLSSLMAIALHFITGVDISTMAGILYGAVTNTPGLGAAQQAYADMYEGVSNTSIALGYAVAYPLGVVGTIISLLTLRKIFRVNREREEQQARIDSGSEGQAVLQLSIEISNTGICGKRVVEIRPLLNRKFVISRILRQGSTQTALVNGDTTLAPGDRILVITNPRDEEAITAFFGVHVEQDWDQFESNLISRRILITKPEINGKHLAQLRLRNSFGANITRVNRSGVDLVASPSLQLQMGDRVTVVGTELAVANAEKILGNSLKRLNHPNLIPIFLGIALGCLLGSIPIMFPGIPQPVKLGLAGGPLIVSILISRFGPQYKLVTYTTMSANLMLREIGIALFLACVGLEAGGGFVDTIVNKGGLTWIGYGAMITILPLLIVGFVAKRFLHVNYFTLVGVLSGGNTNPPALAYSNELTNGDAPAVGYATVYPLSMFLRVLIAQLIILALA